MLSVCSRLSEDNRSCYIINRLTKAVYGFSIRLHIQLLQMCRETAQCLRVRKYCCAWVSEYISLIYTDQCIEHLRVLFDILIEGQFILSCCSVKELCKYFRSECEGNLLRQLLM